MSSGIELEAKMIFSSEETKQEIENWIRDVVRKVLREEMSMRSPISDAFIYNLCNNYAFELERALLKQIKSKLNGMANLY